MQKNSVCSPPPHYHPLIEHAAQLLLEQLTYDNEQYKKGQPISLAAKWCPREKSKFKMVIYILGYNIFILIFLKQQKQQNN